MKNKMVLIIILLLIFTNVEKLNAKEQTYSLYMLIYNNSYETYATIPREEKLTKEACINELKKNIEKDDKETLTIGGKPRKSCTIINDNTTNCFTEASFSHYYCIPSELVDYEKGYDKKFLNFINKVGEYDNEYSKYTNEDDVPHSAIVNNIFPLGE